jgi:hypothetical protein
MSGNILRELRKTGCMRSLIRDCSIEKNMENIGYRIARKRLCFAGPGIYNLSID